MYVPSDDEDNSDADSIATNPDYWDGASRRERFFYDFYDFHRLRMIKRLCIEIGLGAPSHMEILASTGEHHWFVIKSSDFKRPEYLLKVPLYETPSGPEEEEREMILSSNRQRKLIDEVGVLLHLQRYKFLHCPVPVAWDTSTNNAIRNPYLLMEKLPGLKLQDFYYQTPAGERLEIVQALAEYMSKLERISFDRPGRLRARESQTSPWKSKFLQHCTLPVELDIDPFPIDFDSFPQDRYQWDIPSNIPLLKKQPLYSWLMRLIDARLQTMHEDWRPDFILLQDVLKNEVKRENFTHADNESYTIAHPHLNAAKIFMDKVDGKWKVTGVAGWGKPKSVPAVLARDPCNFLISDRYGIRWDNWEDGCTWQDPRRNQIYESQRRVDSTIKPQFADMEAVIRHRFRKEMEKRVPGWNNDIFPRGRVIRIIAKFAMGGIQNQTRVNYDATGGLTVEKFGHLKMPSESDELGSSEAQEFAEPAVA
ncbi:hypothetical protein ACMFMG_000045 [Clarireedia jacksonii]